MPRLIREELPHRNFDPLEKCGGQANKPSSYLFFKRKQLQLINPKYNVAAVPKVVINETIDFEGAVPESDFLKHAKRSSVESARPKYRFDVSYYA